jgi:ferredoxin
MVATDKPQAAGKKRPGLNRAICLGCGVCALKCHTKALLLTKRDQRVIHPETTFERLMLQGLEKGTLQNQLFANPQGINNKFMRAFVGGFLRLAPVKKALLSDRLRSKFLHAMKEGAKRQGKGWVLEM